MADAERNTVFLHQAIGNFLAGCPVAVEFFQCAVLVNDKCLENSIEHGENLDGMQGQSAIERLVLRVDHAALQVMSAEEFCLGFADHGRRFRSAVVDQTGIAFLRHGGRNIGVVAAFLQKNPRTGLSILNHQVFQEHIDVQANAGKDRSKLDGQIALTDLCCVVSIFCNRFKAQTFAHSFAVQRPAGPVQNGTSHRAAVETNVELTKLLSITAEAG